MNINLKNSFKYLKLLVVILAPVLLTACDNAAAYTAPKATIGIIMEVFGTLQGNGDATTIFQMMIKYFNMGMSVTFSIVMSYGVVDFVARGSAANAMQSSKSLLLQLVMFSVGLGFMMPIGNGGYSFAQRSIFTIVEYGVSTANTVFKEVVSDESTVPIFAAMSTTEDTSHDADGNYTAQQEQTILANYSVVFDTLVSNYKDQLSTSKAFSKDYTVTANVGSGLAHGLSGDSTDPQNIVDSEFTLAAKKQACYNYYSVPANRLTSADSTDCDSLGVSQVSVGKENTTSDSTAGVASGNRPLHASLTALAAGAIESVANAYISAQSYTPPSSPDAQPAEPTAGSVAENMQWMDLGEAILKLAAAKPNSQPDDKDTVKNISFDVFKVDDSGTTEVSSCLSRFDPTTGAVTFTGNDVSSCAAASTDPDLSPTFDAAVNFPNTIVTYGIADAIKSLQDSIDAKNILNQEQRAEARGATPPGGGDPIYNDRRDDLKNFSAEVPRLNPLNPYGWIFSDVMDGTVSSLYNSSFFNQDSMTAESVSRQSDPFTTAMTFGKSCLSEIGTIWGSIMGVTFGIGILMAICQCESPMGNVLTVFYQAVKPLFALIITVLASAGLIMGYWLPIFPSILWAFMLGGWLISLGEAIVSAPLICLGLTHPDDHDLLGRAEQGIMLLLSVFVRPVLLVLGMLGALAVTYAGLFLMNRSIAVVLHCFSGSALTNQPGMVFSLVDGIHSFCKDDMSIIIIFPGLMAVYGIAVYNVVTFSFALGPNLVRAVNRWIGIPEVSDYNAMDYAKATAGAMGKIGGFAGQGFTDGASGGASAVLGLYNGRKQIAGGAKMAYQGTKRLAGKVPGGIRAGAQATISGFKSLFS